MALAQGNFAQKEFEIYITCAVDIYYLRNIIYYIIFCIYKYIFISNRRRIWNPVEHLRLSNKLTISAKKPEIVNLLKPLAIFAEELHRGCLTVLLMRPSRITYYCSKKV